MTQPCAEVLEEVLAETSEVLEELAQLEEECHNRLVE